MQDEHVQVPVGRKGLRWGIGASVLLHILVAAAFLVRLPFSQAEAQKEETVQVELVPPPEPEKPKEPEKPELQLPEPPKPEEVEKNEPPPPPPPPEPPKQEPPKPEEAKKPEEPPAPSPPPPQAADQAKAQPLDVLRPVMEFGEKDSGPRKALDGNASQAQAPKPEEVPAAETQEAETQEAEKAPEQAPEKAETSPADVLDKPPEAEASPKPEEAEAAAVADGIALPEVSDPATTQGEGAPQDVSPDAVTAALVIPKPRPDAKAKPTAKSDTAADLPEVKRLFSVTDTGDGVARTAMGGIPRDIRASQLCSTELREQLRHATPAYRPELLPSYRLPSGTVMEVRRGAFRADAQWYDLSFRCELDEGVTKVVSFAFEIGSPIPQSQWRKRGFPEF
jgi:hypothetical protein